MTCRTGRARRCLPAHESRQTATAARARSEIGTSRSRPPLPFRMRIGPVGRRERAAAAKPVRWRAGRSRRAARSARRDGGRADWPRSFLMLAAITAKKRIDILMAPVFSARSVGCWGAAAPSEDYPRESFRLRGNRKNRAMPRLAGQAGWRKTSPAPPKCAQCFAVGIGQIAQHGRRRRSSRLR